MPPAKRTGTLGDLTGLVGAKVVIESQEHPEDRAARIEKERKDADHRRFMEKALAGFLMAVAGACLAVAFSGRYSTDNVGRAFTILSGIVGTAAGYIGAKIK